MLKLLKEIAKEEGIEILKTEHLIDYVVGYGANYNIEVYEDINVAEREYEDVLIDMGYFEEEKSIEWLCASLDLYEYDGKFVRVF